MSVIIPLALFRRNDGDVVMVNILSRRHKKPASHKQSQPKVQTKKSAIVKFQYVKSRRPDPDSHAEAANEARHADSFVQSSSSQLRPSSIQRRPYLMYPLRQQTKQDGALLQHRLSCPSLRIASFEYPYCWNLRQYCIVATAHGDKWSDMSRPAFSSIARQFIPSSSSTHYSHRT